MGLFNRNFDRPGPGVRKDEPRKKGAARFFELIVRDFWDMTKLNIILCLCLLPSLAAFILAFFDYYTGIALILSMLLAYPAGGAIVAYIFYLTKMMRDDPSYVWYEFKRKFKENYRQAAPVGIFSTLFIYAQIMILGRMIYADPAGDLTWLLIALVSMMIFGMIAPYVFMSFAYIALPTFKILKNSVLMSFGYLPRSLAGAVMSGLMWVAFAVLYPYSLIALPLLILFGISISMLLSLMWVWPPFDNHFKVEETLVKRQEEKYEQEQ